MQQDLKEKFSAFMGLMMSPMAHDYIANIL